MVARGDALAVRRKGASIMAVVLFKDLSVWVRHPHHLPSQRAAPEACDQMRLDGVDGDNCNAARHGAILA